MFNFSLASVDMAILTSNLLILIFSLIFRNRALVFKFGFPLLGLFSMLILTRMLFPFEFVPITININLPTAISGARSFFRCARLTVDGTDISIWHLLVLIWMIIFFKKLFSYLGTIKKSYRNCFYYGNDVTALPRYQKILDNMNIQAGLQSRLTILSHPLLEIPKVFRHRMHYYIMIPDNFPFTDEELELVFRHELAHIHHHDLTTRFLIQLLCLFYWWNPLCFLFKRQSDTLFESRIDHSIISEGKERKQKYLDCLAKVAEYSISDNDDNMPTPMAINLCPKNKSVFHERVQMMLKDENKKKKTKIRFLILPICILYLLSLVYIFEGWYIEPKDAKGSESLTTKNTFIIENKNNTYDIYFYGEYWETVPSLQYYPKDANRYPSLKEAKKYEKILP